MTSQPDHLFADKLRAIREHAGLSQYALAQRSGLTKQALSKLELGEREPTWQTVQLLAKALGVDCTAFQSENLALPEEMPVKQRGRPRKDVAEEVPVQAKKPATRKKSSNQEEK